MRALFGSLTTRGRSFVAAGGAATVCGLAIPEPDLVRVGALLVILPLVSALIARRSRYRLACSRRLDPPRVPAGQPTVVTARLENVSRLRTAILLAEDVTPYSLGSRPRFVLDEIEPGGNRELSYQIRSDTRGKFTIGPLRVRVADAFEGDAPSAERAAGRVAAHPNSRCPNSLTHVASPVSQASFLLAFVHSDQPTGQLSRSDRPLWSRPRIWQFFCGELN